jgi:hypothetical protein
LFIQLLVRKGHPVYGLRIVRIDLKGFADIIEGLQAVPLASEDGSQVFEGYGIVRIYCLGSGLHYLGVIGGRAG